MRGGLVSGARTHNYDRNLDHDVREWSGTKPGGTVADNPWTYTVPANYRCEAFVSILGVIRETAAAPLGIMRPYITVAPGGVGMDNLIDLELSDNTLFQPYLFHPGYVGTFESGTVFNFYITDNSTGGTCRYISSMNFNLWAE